MSLFRWRNGPDILAIRPDRRHGSVGVGSRGLMKFADFALRAVRFFPVYSAIVWVSERVVHAKITSRRYVSRIDGGVAIVSVSVRSICYEYRSVRAGASCQRASECKTCIMMIAGVAARCIKDEAAAGAISILP